MRPRPPLAACAAAWEGVVSAGREGGQEDGWLDEPPSLIRPAHDGTDTAGQVVVAVVRRALAPARCQVGPSLDQTAV